MVGIIASDARCHWWVVVSPHFRLAVVVGSLCSLSMVVVGPYGWWWFCSLPLVGSDNGPLLSFVVGIVVWLVDVLSLPAIVVCWQCHVIAWLC